MDASETGRAKRQVDDASNSQGGVVVLALSSFAFYASLFLMRSAMFAAPWTGETAFGFEFKAALAAAQTVVYLVGKVPALALAPKLARSQLLSAMLAILWLAGGLIAASTALPPALAVVFVFLACVALSPCWYVLQRLIEGRSSTEAILSVLSLSVICGSGFAKSVGAALIARGHSDRQMVVFCAALGVGVGTAAALVVGAQPPPSASDIRLRGSRARIGSLRVECGQLLERYGVGIALSTAAYVLCGVLRALRDYFQAELLGAVGLGNSPANFVHSELLIACVVLAATACFARVPDSLRAVRWITATAALGGLLISTASAGWLAGRISGFAWIVGTGAGTFLAYVPMGSLLYERLLSAGDEQITSTPLALLGDTSVLLATTLMLASRGWGGGGGPGGEAEAAAANTAFARFFARLALVGGLAVALLVSAAGAAFSAAVKRRRRRVRLRQQRSADAVDAGERERADSADTVGAEVLRGGPSGELRFAAHLKLEHLHAKDRRSQAEA